MYFKVIEHGADVGVEVHGKDLAELFEGAGLAIMSLVIDPSELKPEERVEVELEANDPEELMFRWLNELIFTIDSRELLPCSFDVKEINERYIRASVEVEKMNPGRHHPQEELKAATYHRMKVEPGGEGWMARVILDV